MLVKLTPNLFLVILRRERVDDISVVIFVRPVVNFINVFRVCFLYKILAPKTTKLAFGFEILVPKILCVKLESKTLMKLTLYLILVVLVAQVDGGERAPAVPQFILSLNKFKRLIFNNGLHTCLCIPKKQFRSFIENTQL
jgi:hypothetical protein